MTPDSSDRGLLGWLPGAQQSYALGLELWAPLEARLTHALANMHEGTFLVCEVPGAAGTDGTQGRKYLQYALDASEHGRRLTAEASALRHQVVTDASAQAQQALIDAMGWTRPDDGNHRRMFAWPLGVEDAVGESMRILRDVWAVTHPALVRIGDETSFGHGPLVGTEDLDSVFSRVAAWVQLLGGSADPVEQDKDYMFATVLDADVTIQAHLEDGRIDLEAVVGVLPRGHASEAAVLRAVSEEALVGCVHLTTLGSRDELVELTVSVPMAGLDGVSFGRIVTWLAGSCVAVQSRLNRMGILANQLEEGTDA